MEDIGYGELSKLGVVLIAGGLGERLGFSGIKISLPVSVLEPHFSHLAYYISYIHACRERALENLDPSIDKSKFYVPLCIMVSDDTEKRTLEYLELN